MVMIAKVNRCLYSSRFDIPEAVFEKPCNAGRVIQDKMRGEGDRHTGYGL